MANRYERAELLAAIWKLGAQDDAHVSATYRRHLVRQLGWRVIEEAK